MTPVSLPYFFSIPESTLNPVLVHREIELPISYDHTLLMGKVCELLAQGYNLSLIHI